MKKIEIGFVSQIAEKASSSQRKRINFNYHDKFSDPINRMLNAIEPGSYVQPHKHESPDKREVFLILSGRIAVIEFNDTGEITDFTVLDFKTGNFGVEISPKVWHMVISLEKGSVVYEIKDGPYEPINDKNFAIWAPKEGDNDAAEYLNKIIQKLKLQ